MIWTDLDWNGQTGLCNEKMASLKGLLDAYGQPLEAGLDSIAAACADKSGMVSGSALVC